MPLWTSSPPTPRHPHPACKIVFSCWGEDRDGGGFVARFLQRPSDFEDKIFIVKIKKKWNVDSARPFGENARCIGQGGVVSAGEKKSFTLSRKDL
jgi:hypothetical protein